MRMQIAFCVFAFASSFCAAAMVESFDGEGQFSANGRFDSFDLDGWQIYGDGGQFTDGGFSVISWPRETFHGEFAGGV